MKRYTKEEFYKRVEQEITFQGLDYVELIEIIEEPGKPYTKSTLVLRDKEYNEIGKIKYMSFRKFTPVKTFFVKTNFNSENPYKMGKSQVL